MIITKIEQLVKITAIVLLTVAAFIYVNAENRTSTSGASFSVDGEGTASAAPDLATFSFSVITEGENADEVQNENNELMNKAIQYVKDQGVEEKDIETSYYDIYPNYDYSCADGDCTNEIDGYTMNQTVEVKVRDTEMIGALLSGVVENGANSVNGPWFEIDDRTDLEQQARQEAFDQAKAKADQIAEAGGFKVGKVIDVYEWTDDYTGVYRDSVYGLGEDTAKAVTPSIETGEEDVTVHVTITYEIK